MPDIDANILNRIFRQLQRDTVKTNEAFKQAEDYINCIKCDIKDFSPLTYYYIICKLDDFKKIDFIKENSDYIKINAKEIFKEHGLDNYSISSYFTFNVLKKINDFDSELFRIILKYSKEDFFNNFENADYYNFFKECYSNINSLDNDIFIHIIENYSFNPYVIKSDEDLKTSIESRLEESYNLMNFILNKYKNKISTFSGLELMNFIKSIDNINVYKEVIELYNDKIKEVLNNYNDSLFTNFITSLSDNKQYTFISTFKELILSNFNIKCFIENINICAVYDLYKCDNNKFSKIDIATWLKILSKSRIFNDQLILNDYSNMKEEFKKILFSFKNINFEELYNLKLSNFGYEFEDDKALEILELHYRDNVNVLENICDISIDTNIKSNTFISNLAKLKYLLKNKIIDKNSDVYQKHFALLVLFLKENKIIEEINSTNYQILDQFFYSIIMKYSLCILKKVKNIKEIALINKAHSKIIDTNDFDVIQIERFNLKHLNKLCKDNCVNKTLVLKLMLMVGFDNCKKILSLDSCNTTLEHLTKNVDFKNIKFDKFNNPILNKRVINLLFKENDIENIILDKKSKLYSYFSRLFSEWNIIRMNDRDKNLNMIIDYLDSDSISLSPKYYRLNGLFKYIGCSEVVVNNTLKLHDEILNKKLSTIPKISGSIDNYSYEILDMDDMEILVTGEKTNCCFTVNGQSKSSLEYAINNVNSRVLEVKKDGELIAQSWLWRAGDLLCIDNIETLKDLNEIDFFNVYLSFADKIIDVTSKYEGECAIKTVTLGYTTFDKIIKDIINYPVMISSLANDKMDKYESRLGSNRIYYNTLPQPIDYSGYSDAKCVQCIIKGTNAFNLKQSSYLYKDKRKKVLYYNSNNKYNDDFINKVSNIVNDFIYRKYESDNKVNSYTHVYIDDFKEIYCSSDWLITVDSHNNINKYYYDYNISIYNKMDEYYLKLKSIYSKTKEKKLKL